MQQLITYFIGKMSALFNLLTSFQIVSGVSVFHFLLALMVVSMLVRSFLHVSR